jgi:hypothetical protein
MSVISQAVIQTEAADAAKIICKALDVRVSVVPQHAWRQANDVQRAKMIGDMMAEAARNEGERLTTNLSSWTPIGGDKYANQND